MSNQSVYIHCGSATRAAALWAVGRISLDGLDVSAAEKEIEQIAKKPEDASAFVRAYLAKPED